MCCKYFSLLSDANLFNSLEVSRSRRAYEGAHVFTQHLEDGCKSDKSEDFEVINRIVNPEGANGWAIVKASDNKAVLGMVSALV